MDRKTHRQRKRHTERKKIDRYICMDRKKIDR